MYTCVLFIFQICLINYKRIIWRITHFMCIVTVCRDPPKGKAAARIRSRSFFSRFLRINPLALQILASSFDISEERLYMKATGIVRRVDDLGRIVIPKEIRRTLRIREGDPLLKTLTVNERYLWAMKILYNRIGVH